MEGIEIITFFGKSRNGLRNFHQKYEFSVQDEIIVNFITLIH